MLYTSLDYRTSVALFVEPRIALRILPEILLKSSHWVYYLTFTNGSVTFVALFVVPIIA